MFCLKKNNFLLLMAIFIMTGAYKAGAEDLPSPINQERSFSSTSAAIDTLIVQSPILEIEVKDAQQVQGDANCIVHPTNNKGKGDIVGATVFGRSGNSLYIVSGTYILGGVGSGSPVAKSRWESRYNSGSARVVLTINGDSGGDDYIGDGVQWTMLQLRLVAAADGVDYTVSSFTGTGLSFSVTSLVLSKNEPVKTIWIGGGGTGAVTISASVDNGAVIVSASGQVVKPIKTPHGDPTTTAGANATNEIVFSSAATGKATVNCEANRIVKDTSKLRWKITDAGAKKAQWSSHVAGDDTTGHGLASSAVYTGLPGNNSDFGAKTVTLSYGGDGRTGQLSQVIELFFDKYATNHPGGQSGSPNWFYYWSQTSANEGIMNYISNASTHTKIEAPDYPCYIGSEVSATYATPQVGVNSNTTLTGIDVFAYATRHEWRHHNQFTSWWGAGGRVASQDMDGDNMPDSLEASFSALQGGPFNNSMYDTFSNDGNLINDTERQAVFTQNAWVVGSANNEDWGAPGMQHRTIGVYND